MGVGGLTTKLSSKLGELKSAPSAWSPHSLFRHTQYPYHRRGLLVIGALLHLLKEPHERSVVREQGM
ncbi:hypothetical protein DVH24_030288 [Malus domestica]|uniref:Uncharacterized protein n=1 Tax=Malus domestica TaxID=3750 RepID=A0A498K2F9_MALDO|nr:hypothetical protein DVH24_030288 [Malus domestica]